MTVQSATKNFVSHIIFKAYPIMMNSVIKIFDKMTQRLKKEKLNQGVSCIYNISISVSLHPQNILSHFTPGHKSKKLEETKVC